jgi:hypothetical protein
MPSFFMKLLLACICMLVLLTACYPGMEQDIFGTITDDMKGHITGQVTKDTAADQKVSPVKPAKPQYCPGAHQFYNVKKEKCDCEDGYYMLNGNCAAESSKECTWDFDCSPDGKASKCTDQFHSARYRCDLRTNTCIPRKGIPAETVDCRQVFDSSFICSNGNCIMKPIVISK